MTDRLRVALISGPMYDHLDALFDPTEVEIVERADHPTLNRRVAARLAAGERLDLISTHSKYAPSQSPWLLPLDGHIEAEALDALAPRALDLCRFAGRTFCLPRLIDVRVLWARRDRVHPVPDTWAELLAGDAILGFTGRESGAFGFFFELVTAAGGSLFDDDQHPTFDTPEAVEAIAAMCRLARRAPSDLPNWHYDEVDAALLAGRVDLAAAWPGGWGPIHASPVAPQLEPHLYPAGPAGRYSYAGCHAWAIPRTAAQVDRSLKLLHRLISAEAGALDAAGGNVCAHEAAFAASNPIDAVDARRREITRATIDHHMITYPPLINFPAIEDAGWHALHQALRGDLPPIEAAASMQAAAYAVVRANELPVNP